MSKRTSIVAVLVFAALVAFPLYGRHDHPAAAAPHSQGCVNQGDDRRLLAPVVCRAQRHLSWKSPHEPHFVLLGNAQRTSLGVAWPPYLVFNSPDGASRWHMFRIGFRYDRSWQGYIFPTVALKVVGRPLKY